MTYIYIYIYIYIYNCEGTPPFQGPISGLAFRISLSVCTMLLHNPHYGIIWSERLSLVHILFSFVYTKTLNVCSIIFGTSYGLWVTYSSRLHQPFLSKFCIGLHVKSFYNNLKRAASWWWACTWDTLSRCLYMRISHLWVEKFSSGICLVIVAKSNHYPKHFSDWWIEF